VLLANGEYVVSPEKVLALGDGDYRKGHATLDAFVRHIRERTIGQLKKLPPPAK
jgi:hypothetical protein